MYSKSDNTPLVDPVLIRAMAVRHKQMIKVGLLYFFAGSCVLMASPPYDRF